MKITIEYDNIDQLMTISRQLAGVTAEPVATATKRTKKAPEPVTGNPDAPVTTVTATASDAPNTAAPVAIVDDAPAEIVKLIKSAGSITKAILGDAVLKCCKERAEGGRGRATMIAILEKFRPAGNTDKVLKLGAVDPSSYSAIADAILQEYTA
jgi:hypothetical protein